MRDIKTREKSIGTIKTIDRASMLSHRVKQASVKAKDQAFGFRAEDERNESAYAEENTLNIAKSGAILFGDSAVKGFRKSRHIKGVIESKTKIEKVANHKGQIGTLEANDTFKEYGKEAKAVNNISTTSSDHYNKIPINTTKMPRKHIGSGIRPTNTAIKQAKMEKIY